MTNIQYQAKWRNGNKDKRIKYDAISKQKKLRYFWSLKNHPCVDCHIIYHPVAMDFDHLPNYIKIAPHGLTKLGIKRLAEEITKCELVCANCHRVRTFNRAKGFSK